VPNRINPPPRYGDVQAPSAAQLRAVSARKLSRTRTVGPGRHRFRVRALLRGTKLAPNRYRVLITAERADGSRAERRARFWLLAPKRR
jgi:hypothetical protein